MRCRKRRLSAICKNAEYTEKETDSIALDNIMGCLWTIYGEEGGMDNEVWREELKAAVHQVEEKVSGLCREADTSILTGASGIFTETEKLPLAYE